MRLMSRVKSLGRRLHDPREFERARHEFLEHLYASLGIDDWEDQSWDDWDDASGGPGPSNAGEDGPFPSVLDDNFESGQKPPRLVKILQSLAAALPLPRRQRFA